MRRHQRAEPSKAREHPPRAREHPPRAREHPPRPRSLLVASPAAAGSIRRTRAAMAHRTYYCCSTASATSRLRLRAWRASWRSLRPPRSPCEHRTRSLLRFKAHVKAPAGWSLSRRTVSSSPHPQGVRVGSDRLSGSASRDCASSSRPSRDAAGPRIAATSLGTHREAQVRVPHKKRLRLDEFFMFIFIFFHDSIQLAWKKWWSASPSPRRLLFVAFSPSPPLHGLLCLSLSLLPPLNAPILTFSTSRQRRSISRCTSPSVDDDSAAS